jgi:hypothetical protein
MKFEKSRTVLVVRTYFVLQERQKSADLISSNASHKCKNIIINIAVRKELTGTTKHSRPWEKKTTSSSRETPGIL